MVITLEVRKLYKYPFERVVEMHLNKWLPDPVLEVACAFRFSFQPASQSYPCPLEKHIRGIKTVEEKTDCKSGIIYRRKIAICNNVVPKILRKINILNVNDIYMEEESWLDMKQKIMNIKSRCLTWTQYASLNEVSFFKESGENPDWTEFYQTRQCSCNWCGETKPAV
uniref:PRELI domain containing 2 n=1 Tax=Erpetoichthys calabaricus TaxID=27687 RepID=A0A8C4S7C8_ERPCA